MNFHKTVNIILLYALVFSARYFYILGLQDAGFDMTQANLKLQQCLDIIKR